jgi:hypothetical protein
VPSPEQRPFPVDGRQFETLNGVVTANVVRVREAGGSADQVWFGLKFADERKLTLVLSDAGLVHDEDGQYKVQTFRRIEDWLNFGGQPKIEYFGPTTPGGLNVGIAGSNFHMKAQSACMLRVYDCRSPQTATCISHFAYCRSGPRQASIAGTGKSVGRWYQRSFQEVIISTRSGVVG